MSRRIAIYTTAGFSAGHRQRLRNIVLALHARDPSIRVHNISTKLYGASWSRDDSQRVTEVELPNPIAAELAPRQVPSASEETVIRQSRPDVAQARKQQMEQALGDLRFDLLVIESFPFLTQTETDEVEHLLRVIRANSPRAAVICSLRDILYGRRLDIYEAAARRFIEAFLARHVDRLLVHGDPHLVRLEESYGDTSSAVRWLRYTGIVVPPIEPHPEPVAGRVVCSLGGRRDWKSPTLWFLRSWRELRRTGRLRPEAHGYVFLGREPPDPEFRQVLQEYRDCFETDRTPLSLGTWDSYRELARRAACSVSQCGYNTCYELLSWQVPAIFVPRPHDGPDTRSEGEQWLRARKVAERGWARTATSAGELADHIAACLNTPTRARPDLNFQGAAVSADNIRELL